MKHMKRRKAAVGTWLVEGVLWIALSLLILILACPAWATDYYVRADGTVTAADKGNATSCSAASTALSMAEFNAATFYGGDTVYFCSSGGDYTSVMIPTSNGSLGAGGEELRITYDGDPDGDGTYAHVKDISVGSGSCVVMFDAGNYTTMQHFEISGCAGEGIYGWAKTMPIKKFKLLHSKIHDVENRGIALIGENAIVETPANYFDETEIAYNEIYANGTDTADNDVGLSRYATNTHVHHNKMYGTATKGMDGVLFSYAGGGNIIEYNEIYNHNKDGAEHGEDGVDIKYTNEDVATPTQTEQWQHIRHNTIYGHTYQTGVTVHYGSRYVKIYNNNIYGNAEGIWAHRGTAGLVTQYIQIYTNLIHYNTQHGVIINDSAAGNIEIYNNLISYNGQSGTPSGYAGFCGLMIVAGTGNVVKNNIISHNYNASTSPRKQIYIDFAGVAGTTLDNNLYYHSGGAQYWYDGGVKSLSTIQSVYSQETHGSESDPLFASSTNFRLRLGSPAINAGVNVCTAEGVPYSTCTGDGTGTWTDIKGSVVPHNGKISIGAYQFTSFDTEQGESAARKSWRRVFRKF